MSAQENNDAMTTTETPEPPQAQGVSDLPIHGKSSPSAGGDEGPGNFDFISTVMGEDGAVLNYQDTSDYASSPESEEEIEWLLNQPFLGPDFVPKAQDIIVDTPDGERELGDVVADIINYIYNPKYRTHPHYPLNDTGIGRLFADSYKWKLRYVSERKQWYEYDKGTWSPCGSKIMEYCKDFIQKIKYDVDGKCKVDDTIGKQIKSTVNKWQSRRARETILKDAASVHPVSITEFDKDPFIFNCKNGTLNFNTWKFNPHRPEDMLTKMANVNYNPNADCARWRQHMQEVMLGDEDLITYLQKALGYALTGDTRFECFFILFGPTSRNGKGVTMNTFLHMLGDYGCNASPETITQKKFVNSSGPSEDIARLAGARFVNISEPDQNMVLSSALVKTLTGNDTITARMLHENSFEYKPAYKIFINTNYLPKVSDPTIFASGRVRVIPFERHFEPEEQDTGLKEELTRSGSLSGILSWCMAGLRQLCKDGFKAENFIEPDAVKNAITKYAQASGGKSVWEAQQNSDDIVQFIADVLEKSSGSEIRAMSAYGRYCEWCEEKGRDAYSQKMFSQKMGDHVTFRRKRPSDKSGTNPVSMIVGYKFKSGE